MSHRRLNISHLGRPLRVLLLMIAGWTIPAASLAAAQGLAAGSATGESVSLTVVPLLGSGVAVASAPLPTVSGVAAPAFARARGAPAAAVGSAPTGAILRTGALDVATSSRMPAAVLTRSAAAAHHAALTLGHLIPLLRLDAELLQSAATLDGACGSLLTASGSARLTGATAGGALGAGLDVPANPAPNTLLLDRAGVRIVLNEQIRSGDGVLRLGLTVNAVHVFLQGARVGALGALSGDLVIAQSSASVECPGRSAGGDPLNDPAAVAGVGGEGGDDDPDTDAVLHANAAANPPEVRADLEIDAMADPPPIAVGQLCEIRFTVTNHGPDDATGVTMSAPLAASVEVESVIASQGSCSLTGEIACDLGTLALEETATVTLSLSLVAAAAVQSTATVSSSVVDSDLSNNLAIASFEPQPAVPPGACRLAAMAATAAAEARLADFAVDLDVPYGATTLIEIDNRAAVSRLARVTLWSDGGIPTLSFTVPLAGYDVRTIDLRDVLVRGLLPAAGGSPVCPRRMACATPPPSGTLATGYLTIGTIDATRGCASSDAADPTSSLGLLALPDASPSQASFYASFNAQNHDGVGLRALRLDGACSL